MGGGGRSEWQEGLPVVGRPPWLARNPVPCTLRCSPHISKKGSAKLGCPENFWTNGKIRAQPGNSQGGSQARSQGPAGPPWPLGKTSASSRPSALRGAQEVPARGDWRPGSPARGETAHVGRAGCVSAGTRALSARPGSPLGHHAPTRWRLRSSGCLSAPEKATSGARRQTGPEPQDSGHGRAARAAKVGFLSPWRPPRASVVGVGRAAAAGPCCGGQTQPEKSGWPHVWWRTGTRRPAVSKPGLGIERSTRSLADKHPLDSMPEAQNSVS